MGTDAAGARPGGGAGAPGPAFPGRRSWGQALKRTGKRFRADNVTDWAATLTYYGVLAVFPGLLALVSVLGVIGSSAIDPMIDNVGTLAPGPARDTLTSMLEHMKGRQGAAGVALAFGVLLALWSASGFVGAFMRAANALYGVGEGRPPWQTLPARLALTLTVVLLSGAIAVGVVFTGTLARRAGQILGVGDTAVTVWQTAKWPVLLLLVALVIAVLYWAAPNVRHGFRWVTPGSLLAVLLWLAASAAFGLYVASFGSYDKTYGSFAAIIVFLVWLWISNIAILLGLEFDAELEREAGGAEERQPAG
ncbi:YihY/virulence factor BrkB family protein [Streptomyces sp. 7-21]|uniref:YihY/virulence factor BrkB family protein n=1 Tax=Streptomyces sp. 7-21 TaxID=2802283 RepID=UPI00191F3DEA|nr:YihY/virulence factor BrkB family protein [Streptomyces sp. 7-21]MBL1065185.1 YihY/virulence factor BrkB family protein [Streptomyces sp. 7-21]